MKEEAMRNWMILDRRFGQGPGMPWRRVYHDPRDSAQHIQIAPSQWLFDVLSIKY